MKYVRRSTNTEFRAIMSRRAGTNKAATLSRICKNGKPGKPRAYDMLGCESTAQDVIRRLEQYNPGDHWVEA